MKTKLLSFIVIIYLNGSYSQNPIIKTSGWNTGCMTSVNMQNNHNIGVSVYDTQENKMSEFKNQNNTFCVNTNSIINGFFKFNDFNNNLNNVNELKV